ncbi:hypothetical protein LI328DRAFT_66222 [Trichoderma asperelloides]|nr:hypothetical protein LI328DRAFT_66222 [Trichoderma asperelloides]
MASRVHAVRSLPAVVEDPLNKTKVENQTCEYPSQLPHAARESASKQSKSEALSESVASRSREPRRQSIMEDAQLCLGPLSPCAGLVALSEASPTSQCMGTAFPFPRRYPRHPLQITAISATHCLSMEKRRTCYCAYGD